MKVDNGSACAAWAPLAAAACSPPPAAPLAIVLQQRQGIGVEVCECIAACNDAASKAHAGSHLLVAVAVAVAEGAAGAADFSFFLPHIALLAQAKNER